jgi:hypothetical protein
VKTSSSSSTGKELSSLSDVCGMKGTSKDSLTMTRGNIVLRTPVTAKLLQ